MKFYLGVTDINWYNYLSQQNREDVNFWQPGGNVAFRVLTTGQPFLFKLKSPINAIAGVVFFQAILFYPCRWPGMYLKMVTVVLHWRSYKE